MTAFDNIKVNNWPATSNDLEDFLVLKLPLNDTAALTESLPVVAGSKTLSAKRTLTNTGVSSAEAGNSKKHYGNNAIFTTSHLATTADSDLTLDSDQWTVEFWIKPDSGMSNEACPVRAGTDYSTDRSPYLGYLSGTNWQLYMSSGAGGSWDIAGGNNFGTLTVGTWKHYAIVRNGTSFKAYENGTETLSLTRNVGAVYQATNSWSIGKAFSSSGYFKGAIQDLRFYKGVAKYTSNFTPPGAILG